MYKTISINSATYQRLQAVASRLSKPKAHVIDELLKRYLDGTKNVKKKELEAYNTFVDNLAKRVQLPERTKIKSEDLDKNQKMLKDQEF